MFQIKNITSKKPYKTHQEICKTALLQNNVVPTMANLYPAEGNPQLPGNAIWFQQDGTPAHYEVNVRKYLHTIFPNRWILPAQSPDLTPLDL
ncbi:hypothetical protein NQ318_022092 [Aromia moschata]|uniref:Uncharacterized protein n=1 Tax=Aromia moschata TaxID=1265417 RepID=A0AAV8Z6B5_9CUCU|nr:hypothetical protein NQ318_022092 [Aromia moschata]